MLKSVFNNRNDFKWNEKKRLPRWRQKKIMGKDPLTWVFRRIFGAKNICFRLVRHVEIGSRVACQPLARHITSRKDSEFHSSFAEPSGLGLGERHGPKDELSSFSFYERRLLLRSGKGQRGFTGAISNIFQNQEELQCLNA